MSFLQQAINRFDRNLFLTVNQLQLVKLNKLISLLTNLGGLFCQTSLALILLLFPPSRNLGFKIAVIQVSLAIVVQIIKTVVARVRPYNVLTEIIPFRIEKDYSFPSGHTAAAFATAFTLSSAFPSGSALWFVLATMIGYSRIYIGVHYPTDVIVGSILGLGGAMILLSFL